MNYHLLLCGVGLAIVFGSHISLYNHMKTHAEVNIAAGLLIAYYALWREGLIRF